MAKDRLPNDAEEKRLRAELTSIRLNSAWAKARRRDRLRLLIAIAVVGLAIWKVPWRSLSERAQEALGVELHGVDAGTP